jgi:hypothetical protein
MVLLIQQHRALQVVTPRTLAAYNGKTLILPGVSTLAQTEKKNLKEFADRGGQLVVLGVDATGLPMSATKTVLPADPAKTYFNALEADFASASANPPKNLLDILGADPDIHLDAPATVAADLAMVNGSPHIYLVNFGGLVPGKVVTPTPVSIKVKVPTAMGSSLSFLPFLGQTQLVHGVRQGSKVEFNLPPLERGAVLSFTE